MLQASLKTEPIAEKRNDPIAWIEIAHKLEAGGVIVDAERALRKAIQLKPDYKPAWLDLVRVLQKQGRVKDAEAAQMHANQLKSNGI